MLLVWQLIVGITHLDTESQESNIEIKIESYDLGRVSIKPIFDLKIMSCLTKKHIRNYLN